MNILCTCRHLQRICRLYSTALPNQAFINGKWVSNADNSTYTVLNPATAEILANVADLTVHEADMAIDAAHKAFMKWSKVSALDRSRMLRRMYELMLQNEDILSRIVTMENGKVLSEAKGEVKYAASFLEWFSEEPRRLVGDIVPSPRPDRRLMVLHQPIGVVGVITPWNFPLAMVTRKLGAILAAGCTAVIKPAEDTPLSLLKFIEIMSDVLPPGVVNIVTASKANGPMIGRVFCTDSRVKSITFTGSSEVGKILYSQCADTMKRLSLELGGNAPLIVFETANIDVAVDACMASKFRNSGQTCVSANRIMVHESIHDEFIKRLLVKTSRLKVGYGLDEDASQGPLINQDALRKVEQLINRSVQMGARIQLGGKRETVAKYPEGYFFQPTVVTDCTHDHPLHKFEIFGPIVAVSTFKTEEEAVKMANGLKVGLAGYLISEDHRQIWRVSEQLQMGIVGVNEGLMSACEAPFSGWNESGIGSESGMYGVEEYLLTKYICWGNL